MQSIMETNHKRIRQAVKPRYSHIQQECLIHAVRDLKQSTQTKEN